MLVSLENIYLEALPILTYMGTLALRLFPLLLGGIFLAELAKGILGEEKLRRILSGSRPWEGKIRAAALGAVLPFCECGSFPVMVALLKAGVSAGTALTFFIISPILSIKVFFILLSFFGLLVSLLYVVITITCGIAASSVLERQQKTSFLKESFVANASCNCRSTEEIGARESCTKSVNKAYNLQMSNSLPEGKSVNSRQNCCGKLAPSVKQKTKPDIHLPISLAWSNTWNTFKKIIPYIALAVIIASIMYNYVPHELMEEALTKGGSYGVILAALAGIPLYASGAMIAVVAPIIITTGAIGPGIAFIIAGTGTSINGLIFMSSIFKRRFLAFYIIAVFLIALIAGYTMQFFV